MPSAASADQLRIHPNACKAVLCRKTVPIKWYLLEWNLLRQGGARPALMHCVYNPFKLNRLCEESGGSYDLTGD